MSTATPTSAQWRARPVFISSTFKDMQAERDYLRNHVFPRLEEKLRERRHQFEPIDLRMGVETAELGTVEAREALVLKVCLEEIQRSRPFLIVILGDRYGWVPPPERMETATREAGFETDVTGKSVTALEIEFGVLKEHPDQRQRSFFYFREPLPYDRMDAQTAALYTDECSSDPQVRAGHDRLKALKQQIKTDPYLKPHTHDYAAKWDATMQRVIGLHDWGDKVFEHLWAVLDEDTNDFASQPPETWEQRERVALAEFIADSSRDFTGRVSLIKQLLEIATSSFPPINPRSTGALEAGITWGACVTGSPGSGKSALMAELYQRLSKDDSIIILANAAGATPRGSEPHAMVCRFIGELVTALGIANPLSENAGPDEVDAKFAPLLARAAEQCRVVVLLDALEQFNGTLRGQNLWWFRAKEWPVNARIIATGITSTKPVEVVSQWAGIEDLELAPLDAPDVTEIASRIWARYHRQINPRVLRVIETKTLPDGKPAAGNPLWLTLSLEQLNLLDADDFSRAEHEFTGSPAERLQTLLTDTAIRVPPDMPSLYGWLLEQSEKAFGKLWTLSFAITVALSRHGWRERDLLVLVPRVALLFDAHRDGSEWTELKLAALRRSFRAHITRRGVDGQLDFHHAQTREAIFKRVALDDSIKRGFHEVIANYLTGLDENDPLRAGERFWHLMNARRFADAAEMWSLLNTNLLSTLERDAVQADVEKLLPPNSDFDSDAEEEPILKGLLLSSDVSSPLRAAVCHLLLSPYFNGHWCFGTLKNRIALLATIAQSLHQVLTHEMDWIPWALHDFALSNSRHADYLNESGLHSESEHVSLQWKRDLSLFESKFGHKLLGWGMLHG